LAETRGERTLRFVPAILAVHVLATLVGRSIWGFDGVVVAMAVAPLAFAFVSWRLTEVTSAVPSMLWSVVQATAFGAAVYVVASALT
jgi:hypothetical protein